MEYLVKKIDQVFVVWLAVAKRFVLFREPAFHVFRLWSDNVPEEKIIAEIKKEYRLPKSESKRFTGEIINRVMELITDNKTKEPAFRRADNPVMLLQKVAARNYMFNEKAFRIDYGNAYIESGIHPKFQHLEDDSAKADEERTIRLSFSDGSYHLAAGKTKSYSRFEHLMGAVYLNILDFIHKTEPDFWMGIFHASAVAKNNGSILFVAPSGSGKSTIASLLMANGYKLLSDDFVPVSISEPEVHQFPAAISLKGNAIPEINEHFAVPGRKEDNAETIPEKGTFIPFPEDSFDLKKTHAKAIVFVRFDPMTSFYLKKESNLEMMNELLEQLWIPGNARAAGRFLDWYFSLPVYTLRYSDNEKAVNGMKELLSS
jgi:hypothetical protein